MNYDIFSRTAPAMPKLDTNLSFERYTFGVYLELHKALEGLVGKE